MVSGPEPRQVVIELLFWRGCDSWGRALADLRAVVAEAGLDVAGIKSTEVVDDTDAQRLAFVGSPTVRVDGIDVDEPSIDEPYGLTCRVYRRSDGRISPLPDREQIRTAIQVASGTIGERIG